jgi:hypothetical protein
MPIQEKWAKLIRAESVSSTISFAI